MNYFEMKWRLSACRIQAGYSQAEVAEILGCSDKTIVSWEQVRQLLRWRKHRSLAICTVSLWLIWIFQRLETLHLLESVRVSHRSQLFNL